MAESVPHHKGFWIEPKVSLGDILMALGFAIGGISAFFILSERVSVNHAMFISYKEAQDNRTAQLAAEAQLFRQEVIRQLETLNSNVISLREKAVANEIRSRKEHQ